MNLFSLKGRRALITGSGRGLGLRFAEGLAEAGAEVFRMEAMELPYDPGVFKYQLKCLRELRSRLAALDGAARAQVDPLLGPAWMDLIG